MAVNPYSYFLTARDVAKLCQCDIKFVRNISDRDMLPYEKNETSLTSPRFYGIHACFIAKTMHMVSISGATYCLAKAVADNCLPLFVKMANGYLDQPLYMRYRVGRDGIPCEYSVIDGADLDISKSIAASIDKGHVNFQFVPIGWIFRQIFYSVSDLARYRDA